MNSFKMNINLKLENRTIFTIAILRYFLYCKMDFDYINYDPLKIIKNIEKIKQ